MNKIKLWPYWVRGAIILGIILLPIFWAESIAWTFPAILLVWVALGSPLVGQLTFALVGGTAQNEGMLSDAQRFWQVALMYIFYVLLGAFLGYLYGKFKNRKKSI